MQDAPASRLLVLTDGSLQRENFLLHRHVLLGLLEILSAAVGLMMPWLSTGCCPLSNLLTPRNMVLMMRGTDCIAAAQQQTDQPCT